MAMSMTTTVFSALPSVVTTKPLLGFQPSGITTTDIIAPFAVPKIPLIRIPPTLVGFRFRNVAISQKRQRVPKLFADPSEGDIAKGKTDENDISDARGPPILTILAGFVVFFFVFWILGSIVAWLIGLIVNVSPPK